MPHLRSFPLIYCLFLVLFANVEANATENDADFFVSEVWPIFVKHCHGCHGPDKQESNYRLDVREIALRGGDIGDAIQEGDSASSHLVAYVSREEDSLAMPPDGEGEPLNSEQIQTLKRWIDAGAPWPHELAGVDEKLTTDHWSFQPIEKQTPPTSASVWPRNEIDQFVLGQLTKNNLEPSATAARNTLLRRLYLDVHGLPPTRKQMVSFLNDPSANAYEKRVDEVLESSHYGERWARHWLDIVRFGESTGYEVNRDRENAWHYRDYVIDALNQDKSYREFVIDQLAGDVVGDELGTGFLVGGPYDMVKSPDKNLTLMQRQDELADYVNTTATTFLGLTVGCARCHNHKFDPILQRDFYAMQAVFAGVEHGERELSGPDTLEQRQKIQAAESKLAKLESEIAALREQATESHSEDFREPVNYELNTEHFDAIEAKFVRFTILETSTSEPCLDELEILSVDDVNVALTGRATASGTLPGYEIHKLEHINDGKVGNQHSWISNSSGGWVQIELARPVAVKRIRWGRDRTGQIKDRLATRYTIEASLDASEWTEIASSRGRMPFGKPKADDASFVDRLPASKQSNAKQLIEQAKQRREEAAKARSQIPKAYVGTFKKPETIYRLYRGDPLAPREAVPPGALSVVTSLGLSDEVPESRRRLKFAEWIANSKNPLTARVIVNRVWHYHFGAGIVSTPSDFGKNGTSPSHPALLDWLAWNFMRNDWSLKWLHREILRSATYRQSSRPRADALAKDADCRLLWRFPPRRLEAESIRDCVLHVSGALEHRGGGPGFLLLEIDHENVHHYFPKKELGPPEFRRMIYMTKIRQEQDAVFGVFDCPDGGQVIPDRSRSTTPLQALNLLNSTFMLDQAAALANRLQHEEESASGRIRRLYELAYGRQPTESELSTAKEVADRFDLKAVCRAVLNSNEFLFVP